MAGQLRIATMSMTASYQNILTLLNNFSGNPLGDVQQFVDGWFRVPTTAAHSVRISIASPGATTGNDNTSNLVEVGGYLSFEYTDLALMWAKSSTSTSTLEFAASEAPGTS